MPFPPLDLGAVDFDSLNSIRDFVGRLVFPSCGVSVCVLQGKSLGFGTACEAGQAAAAVQAHHELVAQALSRRAAWQKRRRRRSRASAAEPPRD